MKPLSNYLVIASVVAFCTGWAMGQSPALKGAALTADDKKIISDFEDRTEKYVELRETLRKRLPKVPDEATPEQIAAQKAELQKSVQAARINAVQGNVFTQSATGVIRSIIKTEFKGYERAEIRQKVLEADTKGVPIKVNFPYPESKELIEMSPALLLKLPQLPKQLRYRYIGRSLVILDRDIALIIDFMREALP